MSQYPVLSKLQGDWRGSMRYAAGDDLALAPFTLSGSMCVSVNGTGCVIESSVVLPNGQERAVVMSADDAAEGGQLRFSGEGPIDALVTEIAPDTVLLREVERESGRVVMSVSMQMLADGELRQIAHELAEGGGVSGVQMWTFVRDSPLDS